MSEFKIKKNGRHSVSPQMALLHIRWQQIRWELLQQAADAAHLAESPQTPHPEARKEEYAIA